MTAPRRIKLLLEYDGAPFAGWQRQENARSIQAEIESALAAILGHAVTLHGAGRTDAGVHALGMVAHFDTTSPIPVARLPLALASHLPAEIAAASAEEAPPDFDARRDAVLRWYRYQIDTRREPHPLGPRAWKLHRKPDLEKLAEAISALSGRHDFAGFRAVGCEAERTLLDMREASLAAEGGLIGIDFKCPSFLRRMVRLMVGAAAAVALDRFGFEDFIRILDAGRRPDTIPAAPPEGLCLMRIAYCAPEAEKLLTERRALPSF